MDFWHRIEQLRTRHDVLRHPFYLRWSAGELTREELARYAGEYRHAVVALADAASTAAEQARRHEPALAATLEQHAREEEGHVALWDGFAKAAGANLTTPPLPKTADCARAWAGASGRPLLDSLVAMYVIEAAQPAVAETKRVGLTTHYGLGNPTATAYFDVHVELDVVHAAAGRKMIEERLVGADEGRLIAEAESVLRANWELLDGVEHGGVPRA
jgi:pyrroloquinoline-quinone synthase